MPGRMGAAMICKRGGTDGSEHCKSDPVRHSLPGALASTVLALACSAPVAFAQTKTAEPTAVLFEDVRVFDGKGDRLSSASNVVSIASRTFSPCDDGADISAQCISARECGGSVLRRARQGVYELIVAPLKVVAGSDAPTRFFARCE